MKLNTLGKKIGLGYALIALLFILTVSIMLWQVDNVQKISERMRDLRGSTAQSSLILMNAVHQSLSNLRAWISENDPKFKLERQRIWDDQVNNSVARLNKLSEKWTNPDNIKRFTLIKSKIQQLGNAQKAIEIAVNKPNSPVALKLYAEEINPLTSTIDKQLELMVANQDQLMRMDLAFANTKISILNTIGWLLLGFGVIACIVLSILVTRYVSVPIRRVVSIADKVAEGDFDFKTNLKGSVELVRLGKSFNIMSENLKLTAQKNRNEAWLKSGQAELADIIRGEQDIPTLSRNIITFLAKYLKSQVGTFYRADEDGLLHLTGSFAYLERNNISNKLNMGEGLVGQAALEGEVIILSDVPDNYMPISSSLGQVSPKNIIVVPAIYEKKVVCVYEIGSVEAFNEIQIDYLKSVATNIAVAINLSRDRDKLNLLLNETQEQSRKLESQQNQLKSTNAELEKQAAALKKSEEILKAQSEELQVSNEELEEKTEFLEKQKVQIEKQNVLVKAAKKEIEQKAKDLEQVSKYKSEFMSNMSHELRTPLNSLLILSKTLADNADKNLTPEQVDAAKVIYGGGRDLLSLINDILDLSKVEAGKLSINVADISVSQMVKNIEGLFKPLAEQKGLKFKIDISKDLPEVIKSDDQRVEQIIKNLLSNAFKFTSEGSITLKIYHPGSDQNFYTQSIKGKDAIAFSVIDTGIGIEPDKKEAIFEAFQQADGSTSRQYGGTGLGLTISRELAHLLGGEVQLMSEVGKGSEFTLYLPLEAGDSSLLSVNHHQDSLGSIKQGDQSQSNITAEANLQNKTILIIEDDKQFAAILMNLAKQKGCKCLVANDGIVGLALAYEHLPSAILLDLSLPGISGKEILSKLKQSPETKNIPVHVITGSEDQEMVLSEGAIGYLKKPVTSEELNEVFSKIERLLNNNIKEVLIVEDDAKSQEATKSLLNSKNINHKIVASATEAESELVSGNYDCIILGLNLPDKSDFELLQHLHDDLDLKLPPVVIYTDRDLSQEDHKILQEYSSSIIMKGENALERLSDEVTLFLNQFDNTSASASTTSANKTNMSHAARKNLSGKKVLLVDDDMRNNFALAGVLNKEGLEVSIADNGRMALEKLEQEGNFDLVIMDIMMPVMDGYEAMEKIRQQDQYASLPIIALTAKVMPEDRAKAIECGANDYLTKPVDIDKLLSLIKVWLFEANE